MRIPNHLHFFTRTEHPVLSLEVQARMGAVDQPERSQFALLVLHFLERFFNNEMISSDDEGKARLIQVACATGVPGFIAAVALWVPYHNLFGRPRPHWTQVSDHYFFVVYSLVAMGVITVFEWDLFFPDLLDLFVLSSLPIKIQKLFMARIAAISIFVAGFLFDANVLATLILPEAIDPPSLWRFLAAHVLAVTASGVFAASVVLALQGLLLAVFGARFFRRISLFLQGLFITALLMLFFLYPALSGVLPAFMHSQSTFALYFPPFWFLGIYERLMGGPSSLPIYAKLAQTGCVATLLTVSVAALSYPFAYSRRTRGLIQGSGARNTRSWVAIPINRFLHATVLWIPAYRAIYHFISQTLLRVQRYRIYLIMYGGVGLSLVAASVLRLDIGHRSIHIDFSSDGIRAAVPIAAFWTITGLRMAFVSPGDPRGGWVFRSIHGKPMLHQLVAAKIWVLVWTLSIVLGTIAVLHAIALPEMYGWRVVAGQVLVAAGLCLLLTDAFFLNVKVIPFTGVRAPDRTNLAIVLLKYFAFFPPVVLLVISCEPWIEVSLLHMVTAGLLIVVVHLVLRAVHQSIVEEYRSLPDLDGDEEEFPLELGLRY